MAIMTLPPQSDRNDQAPILPINSSFSHFKKLNMLIYSNTCWGLVIFQSEAVRSTSGLLIHWVGYHFEFEHNLHIKYIMFPRNFVVVLQMNSKQDFVNTVSVLYSSPHLILPYLFLMLATFPMVYRKLEERQLKNLWQKWKMEWHW